MKAIISFLSVFLFGAIGASSQEFKIQERELTFNTREFLHPMATFALDKAAKYRGHYVCHFMEWQKDPNIGMPLQQEFIFAISDDGTEVKSVKTGKEPLEMYDEMFVRNDSLLVSSYQPYEHRYHITYEAKDRYQEGDWRLEEVKTPSHEVYADKKYIVSRTDIGEWGTYLDFKDKRHHLFATSATRIFKMSDAYYLVSKYTIEKIVNPKVGAKAEASIKSQRLATPTEVVFETAKGNRRSRLIAIGPQPDSSFVGSFVHNGDIHIVMQTSRGVSIERFTGKGLTRVMKIFDNPVSLRSSAFGQNTAIDEAFMFFCDSKTNTNGVVDIKGDSVKIMRFKDNQSSFPIVGKVNLEEKILYCWNNLDNLTSLDIIVKEQEYKSVCAKMYSEFKVAEGADDRMLFHTLEDSTTTLTTQYYYNHGSMLIDRVIIERTQNNEANQPPTKASKQNDDKAKETEALCDAVRKATNSAPTSSSSRSYQWKLGNKSITIDRNTLCIYMSVSRGYVVGK